MSCPDCGKESRQTFDYGHSATMDTPAEPAGWDCGWCGNFYSEPADEDYAYEESRQREIDDEV